MKMSFRWYGHENETFPLEYVRQIPGMHGIVSGLFDVPVGGVWPMEKILAIKFEIESVALRLETIESVNVHEDIKLGLPTRDRYIANYLRTLENLASVGINVVCYNFMPVFDWTRTDLAKVLPDGSTVLSYDAASLDGLTPEKMAAQIAGGSNGFKLTGWEPERLQALKIQFEKYKAVDEEKLKQTRSDSALP